MMWKQSLDTLVPDLRVRHPFPLTLHVSHLLPYPFTPHPLRLTSPNGLTAPRPFATLRADSEPLRRNPTYPYEHQGLPRTEEGGGRSVFGLRESPCHNRTDNPA